MSLKVSHTTEPELKESNGLTWNEWYENGIRKIELTGDGLLSDEETATFKAEFMGSDEWKAKATHDSPFEILIQEDCDVYGPPGADVFEMFNNKTREEDLAERLFLVFRKHAISPDMCVDAWKGLRGAARPSKNRGVAGGKVDVTRFGRDEGSVIPVGDGTRAKYVSKDGIVSDTVEANMTMGGIAGYFPPTARHPFWRPTAYTRDNWELFQGSWPFLQEVARLYERLSPLSYANQMEFIQKFGLDEKGWVVPQTPFSTITVNKNFQTACHQDKGDFKAGMECFAVLEAGEDEYDGGYTCFPKFRTAFDARTGDFVAMDVAHHWHGNLAMESRVEGKDDWERISLVLYVREDVDISEVASALADDPENAAGSGTQAEEIAKHKAWEKKHRKPMEQHAFRKDQRAREAASWDVLDAE